MKKYEIIKDDEHSSRSLTGKTVYRIKALRDFGDVKAGDLGGYIESEKNLSHDNNCWVGGDAKVYENAIVSGNALVYGTAQIYCDAKVLDYAKIFDNSSVFGYAVVRDLSKVYKSAQIFGDCVVRGNSEIYGDARVFSYAVIDGYVKVYGNSEVQGSSKITGNVEIYDYAEVFGYARVKDNAKIYGEAQIFGDAEIYSRAYVYGKAQVSGGLVGGKALVYGITGIHSDVDIDKKAIISSKRDFMFFDCIGSEDTTITVFKTKKGIRVNMGCFNGSFNKFKKGIEETHKNDQDSLEEFRLVVKLIEKRMGGEK